jgi:NAD(P)-dependent dehydrogenase (short-subunit alcohol dehydrogenase family)
MAAVLITGSNRGLGLEWVRQCAARGWRVFATCRDPDSAKERQALASAHPGVVLNRLGVTAPDLLADLAEALREQPISVAQVKRPSVGNYQKMEVL